MPRTYYDVIPAGREWAVQCRSRLLSLHMDKCGAVSIAAAVAQGEHDATGQPTGVRVRLHDGRWDEQGLFGNEAPIRYTPAALRPAHTGVRHRGH